MIEFHSRIWASFESILARWGPIRTLDILTAYLGAGASKVLAKLRAEKVRIVFGLDSSNPALSQKQIDELNRLKRIAHIRTSRGLHAKLYLFNDRVLVIGSANFTQAGFGYLREAILETDEISALAGARRFLNEIWEKRSSELPKKLGTTPVSTVDDGTYEGRRGLGRVSRPETSPFDEAGENREPRDHRTKKETPIHLPRVRLCAYPAYWLLEAEEDLERGTKTTWSSGPSLQRGDVQVFCISRDLREAPNLAGDPRIDSVHSLWKAVTGLEPGHGNEEFPNQAKFSLLVRLMNPVPRGDLVKAKLLVRRGSPPRWPQGTKGKIFHLRREIEILAQVLSRRNPNQKNAILKALGLRSDTR